jgi:pilus assembly protein Flp/PilA
VRIEANTGKESDDMEYMKKLLSGLNGDRNGVTALEYGMIAALIAVVVIGGFSTLGGKLSNTISTVNASLTASGN